MHRWRKRDDFLQYGHLSVHSYELMTVNLLAPELNFIVCTVKLSKGTTVRHPIFRCERMVPLLFPAAYDVLFLLTARCVNQALAVADLVIAVDFREVQTQG